LDSYSKEMWAGQDVTLKSVAFSISGRIRACLNTHYLPAETPSRSRGKSFCAEYRCPMISFRVFGP
jgi:hypothetical protein